jgi:cbb3-type cytochrome oxidase maturation protein
MDEATLALTILTVLIFMSLLGLFVWGVRSGQFRNIEEAKYRIFRENKTEITGDSKQQDSKAGGGNEE